MKDIFTLEGKSVVITGGAGYLGTAMTKGLLAFGAEVVVADIAEKSPKDIVGNDVDHNKLYCVKCDLSKTDSIKEMLKKAKEICGKIDILINCATYNSKGPIDEMSDESWAFGIDGSLGTAFRCTREVLPYFKDNKKGTIVNIGSMYGVVSPDPSIYGESGQNQPPNYGAGKAGVIQLTRYCAAHLAKYNVRVNCLTPGPFPSPEKNPPKEFIERMEKKTMLGRIGKPKDLVGALILLTSDASSYMTGQNIIVDGGWTAW